MSRPAVMVRRECLKQDQEMEKCWLSYAIQVGEKAKDMTNVKKWNAWLVTFNSWYISAYTQTLKGVAACIYV